MRPMFLYVDTSVFGDVFDTEFSHYSKEFFTLAKTGRYALAVSERVVNEIDKAPAEVRDFFNLLYPMLEVYQLSHAVIDLRDAYIGEKILGLGSLTDATHVAFATVNACDGLVSWNFKHILHPVKKSRFNQVNSTKGYGELCIVSPKEVRDHDGKPQEG